MPSVPHITIRWLSPHYARYFDWLIAGLGQLSEDGACTFGYSLSGLNRLTSFGPARWLARRAFPRSFLEYDARRYYLGGTVEWGENRRSFIYDIWDSPFHFFLDELEECDLYFKAQFPRGLAEKFHFSRESAAPLAPQVFRNRGKLRKAMLGRPLGKSIHWQKNVRVLRKMEAMRDLPKETTLFAYFGDYRASHREPFRRFGGQMEDPKAKRAEIVRLLKAIGSADLDVGMVSGPDADLLRPAIPRTEDFMAHVAKACFNVNVSGIDRSLPFRFADSFMVGTSVVSDAIGIEFYQPFLDGVETVDLGPMGYELWDDVDWSGINRRLRELHATAFDHARANRRRILERYNSVWCPKAFAGYLLQEILSSK